MTNNQTVALKLALIILGIAAMIYSSYHEYSVSRRREVCAHWITQQTVYGDVTIAHCESFKDE